MESKDLAKITYWINCEGTSPVSDELGAIEIPLNALSNDDLSGVWDALKGQSGGGGACYTATASIGAHVGTTPLSGDGKACTTSGFDSTSDATRTGTELCTSRQTVRS